MPITLDTILNKGDKISVITRNKINTSKFYYVLPNDNRRSTTSFEKCFEKRVRKFFSMSENSFRIENVQFVENKKVRIEFTVNSKHY